MPTIPGFVYIIFYPRTSAPCDWLERWEIFFIVCPVAVVVVVDGGEVGGCG
jgi:hypothetical protein